MFKRVERFVGTLRDRYPNLLWAGGGTIATLGAILGVLVAFFGVFDWVDGNGNGANAGDLAQASATATAGDAPGTVAVTVSPPAVASVMVSSPRSEIPIGETAELTATLRDETGDVLID
ncbi:MAG: hypothetical protein HOH95_06410 [Dehalococcoidia bacterium]|nr:hypothetical protein [Dehalococcoidia bacterium]